MCVGYIDSLPNDKVEISSSIYTDKYWMFGIDQKYYVQYRMTLLYGVYCRTWLREMNVIRQWQYINIIIRSKI